MKVVNKVLKMMIFTVLMLGIAGVTLPRSGMMKAFEKLSLANIGRRFQQLEIFQKPLEEAIVTEAIGVPYYVETLPIGSKRPGSKRKIKYIVVHNTANATSTAQNERDYLSNPNNTSSTSWHIAVDEDEMIEAVPVTEVAFHAGDREGNKYGIGIEICESGSQEKTEANAIKLIAYLMKTYDIPIENVKTHQDFSGKECPRKILDHWGHFKEDVEEAYNNL